MKSCLKHNTVRTILAYIIATLIWIIIIGIPTFYLVRYLKSIGWLLWL